MKRPGTTNRVTDEFIPTYLLLAILLVLLTSAPVYAHDCSSESDCANVIRSNAWLATILAVIAALAAAKAKKWTTLESIKKPFKNCGEAAEWLKTGPETGWTDAQLKDSWQSKAGATRQPDGTFKFEGKVKWSVDPSKSTMQLTELTWKNMTPAEAKALADFKAALEAHEIGHIAVAETVAKEFSETTITGTGVSPDEARKDFDRKLQEHEANVTKVLGERTKTYDEVTDHGRKQSRIDGNDVRLNCP